MRRTRSRRGQEAGRSRLKGWLAWGVFGLTVALLAAALVLSLGGDVGGTVGSFAATIGFAGVGAVVAARTSNKVGWLLLAEGLALALALGTKDYAGRSGGASLPGAPWAGWILTLTLNAIFPPLLLALLLFPDGRLPSARWRPVAWATVAAGAVGVACNAVADVNFSSNFPHLADPVTIAQAGLVRGVYNGTLEGWPFILLACAASLAVRLVRSRGEQRPGRTRSRRGAPSTSPGSSSISPPVPPVRIRRAAPRWSPPWTWRRPP